MVGLFRLVVFWDLLGAVKQLEALPYDNDNQCGKDDFRKAQHVRSQSTFIFAALATAKAHLYSTWAHLETGQWQWIAQKFIDMRQIDPVGII